MIAYITDLNSDNFQEKTKSGFVLVDIMADWCQPCKALSPIIDEISSEFGQSVLVGKMDADKNMDLVKSLGVRNIPTVLLYKDGKIVDRFSGLKSKSDIINLIQPHIV